MSEQERYQHAYLMLEHWIDALYHGNRVFEYFSNLGYKNIAIYGMGDLANRLLDDLEGRDRKSTRLVLTGMQRELCAGLRTYTR